MDNRQAPILVTGATGSIGAKLVRRLSAEGRAVRALVRSEARAAVFKDLPGVTTVTADLARPESLRGCADGCAAVYHCAAKLSGSNRAAFTAVNVRGTQALLEEIERAGVERLVYLSTIGVYGFTEAEMIREDHPLPDNPLPYIQTKQEAERVVRDASTRIPTVIARLGDIYGPGQNTWTIHFIDLLNRGFLHPPIDAESGTLNLAYIDNLVDALILMKDHPAATGQVFNVVDGTPMRASDYIRRMAAMAGKKPFAVPGFVLKASAFALMASALLLGREAENTPGDVNYLLHRATISGEKIRAALGWQPAVSLEEALNYTEAWLRQSGLLP